MARPRLGELLMNAAALRREQLDVALKEQQRWGGHLGQILLSKGFISEEMLVRALSSQLRIDVVDVENLTIDKATIELVPGEMAHKHNILPFKRDGKFLDVAMSDPLNQGITDDLRLRTQFNIRPYIAAPSAIIRAIRHHYGVSPIDAISIDDVGEPQTDWSPPPLQPPAGPSPRDAEIDALQRRVSTLEALIVRDEDVLRKLMRLLIDKGLATREEILAAIK